MVTETATEMYETATNLYVSWVDASVSANERFVRVARVWLDEALGTQRDLAEAMKRSLGEAQSAFMTDGDLTNPLVFATRAGDMARSNYFAWSEAGLKTQERLTRLAQTAFQEMQTVQSDLSARVERQMTATR